MVEFFIKFVSGFRLLLCFTAFFTFGYANASQDVVLPLSEITIKSAGSGGTGPVSVIGQMTNGKLKNIRVSVGPRTMNFAASESSNFKDVMIMNLSVFFSGTPAKEATVYVKVEGREIHTGKPFERVIGFPSRAKAEVLNPDTTSSKTEDITDEVSGH